jgi:hypothetical protein
MGMKRYLQLTVIAAALAACDSPSDNDVVQYDMVSLIGDPLPVQLGTPLGGDPNCVDSLYTGTIEINGSNARRVYNQVHVCGSTRTVETREWTGTTTTQADTVDFHWRVEGDPLIGGYSEEALVSGDLLNFSTVVYTEDQPDGSGQRYTYAVFRRR